MIAGRDTTVTARRRAVMASGVAILVVLADQLSKALVVARLGPDRASHARKLVGDLLAVEYAENRGIAFGLLQGQTVVVTLLAVAILIVIGREYRRLASMSLATVIGAAMIAGGAAGNLVDRIRLGYVVDFIALPNWPNFNLADSAITIGALLFVWRSLRSDGREQTPAEANPFKRRSSIALLTHDGDR